MKSVTSAQTSQTNQRAVTPAPANILQRQCACGQHTPGGGACSACQQKEQTLQRAAISEAPTNGVPPIVNEVLNSPGQPLDAATSTFMGSRFGHDFTGVRVHTDSRAADSARSVNALAYTVGQNVVFGTSQYAPNTHAGKQLLAHELTHVVQQYSQAPSIATKLTIGLAGNAHEQEADRVAERVISGNSPVISLNQAASTIQRQTGGAGSGGATPTGAGSPRFINTIRVNLNRPQTVSLSWSDGTETSGIQCSTGKGRCCPHPCDPPNNEVNGSNCTPSAGSPYRVDNKYPRTGAGLNYFVSFLPGREIGLHEYSPVDGTPISHGCVRLHRADAMTVYNGTVPGTTRVQVSGVAVPTCPRPGAPACRTTTSLNDTGVPPEEVAVAQNEEIDSTSELDPPQA